VDVSAIEVATLWPAKLREQVREAMAASPLHVCGLLNLP